MPTPGKVVLGIPIDKRARREFMAAADTVVGPVGRKICRRCRVVKPVAEFYGHPTTRDGLQSWCKPCLSRRGRL
jgi:hypothetical protein